MKSNLLALLADREAIGETLSAYCFHADSGDHKKRAALFTRDGVLETPQGTYSGRTAIEVFVGKSFPINGQPARKHCVMNAIIELDGDLAEVQSYLIVVRETEQSPAISFGGRYLDKLVKSNGVWLFQQRKVVSDLRAS